MVSSATFSSVRNFAIGPDSLPSSPTRTQARPLAPCEHGVVAELVEELAGLRRDVRDGSARTCLPAKALNSEPSKTSVMSTSSSWARRSGLSEPYFSIASRNGIRGNGDVTSRPLPNSVNSSVMSCSIGRKTSSCSTKLISTSSW